MLVNEKEFCNMLLFCVYRFQCLATLPTLCVMYVLTFVVFMLDIHWNNNGMRISFLYTTGIHIMKGINTVDTF